MEKLNNKLMAQLKNALKKASMFSVEMDETGESYIQHGTAEYEIEYGGFTVLANIEASQIVQHDSGDYYNAPSSDVLNEDINVSDVVVLHEDLPVILFDTELKEIEELIKLNITLC